MHEANIPSAVADFLRRWEASGAAERANYQLFLSEFCDVLGVPRPEPTIPDDRDNAYVFERAVTFHHGTGLTSTGRIDLYKRGCFVLEAKQGSDKVQQAELFPDFSTTIKKGTAVRGTQGWDVAMLKAKGQAEQYARALPVDEGWPPFLVVVDVGHEIELFSEFSCTGKAYIPFPDPRSYRIPLADLAKEEVRDRLRAVWTAPHDLDPSKRSAKVTRDVADKLARLAKSLELVGHTPERVGNFLKRCLFTMFSEDVGLIPEGSFTTLLVDLQGTPEKFAPLVQSLWETMRVGGFSPVLREKLLRFNGGLFEDPEALPVGEEQLALLVLASKADWRDVEPAIFGTLLERALDPMERHHLGAHYTPRAYVERLVLPTVVEPLRADWEAVLAASVSLATHGKTEEAIAEVRGFHSKLCEVRVLDPACGSGNFLYVTFEHLKRLEGEVLNTLSDLGDKSGFLDLAGVTVDPHQLLGIEVNPRAAAITDMVLWIGYLQWHFRTRGNVLPPEPVVKKLRNIECRDAVLAYDAVEPIVDELGQPVTRWDGCTTKTHPVTGKQVPDETAQVPLLRYDNPRPAKWPKADFVVGNPPFIGAATMRRALGDGYVEALRKTYKDVPDSAEFVMFWWHNAAHLARTGKLRRFGFITTNSLTQTFNRKVVQHHMEAKKPMSVVFAIPDHPWVDSADGAAVRIAMTAGEAGSVTGRLNSVVSEEPGEDACIVQLSEKSGTILADLTIGANVASARPLRANETLANRGVQLFGAGFLVTPDEATSLGLGRIPGLDAHVRPYRNGRDLTSTPRQVLVADLFGLSEAEVRERFPEVYQWVLERVKPERDQNNRASYRDNWWFFGEPRKVLRKALEGLPRYIATVETAKHRTFLFLDKSILPDNKLVAIASADAFVLGVLSSIVHVSWSLTAGSWLGVGNDSVYVKTRCFETFPFPSCTDAEKDIIRKLAESLDAHRKRQQALYPSLTLTDMYNVLVKLRSGEPLTEKEKTVNEQGLVSVLRHLHDELDLAVFASYGWAPNLSEEEVLEKLVALNRERAKEEELGLVRWLRPEFQNAEGVELEQQATFKLEEVSESAAPATSKTKAPWPKTLPEQMQAIRAALAAAEGPVTTEAIARTFLRARADKVGILLTTLAAIGQAREVEPGSYVG
ncbi:MAG: class I SAM-dependent DNA methyltransferase [Geobacter sp.]|nr:MAG: class I SAM-dependent DNA methyltransferase [Geobacter sp.]